MPGKERSLASKSGVVERSLIGDRVVKGRLEEHLVLPLEAINVHIGMSRRGHRTASSGRCVTVRCTYRGVYRGVYTRWVPGHVPTAHPGSSWLILSHSWLVLLPGLASSDGFTLF